LGITLRYPYEIRNEAEYFGDLPDEKVPKELLDLATHIVATRTGHFRPEKFKDHGGCGKAVTRPVAVIRRTTRI
jgi:DNA end-binding protein Ku